MISFEEIKTFFAEGLRKNPTHFEYMLKEYFHYRMLDVIFSGEYASKLSFIGGTSLRILHQIQRFSEDLDFDCFVPICVGESTRINTVALGVLLSVA